jgi:hypothetical protein
VTLDGRENQARSTPSLLGFWSVRLGRLQDPTEADSLRRVQQT